jgi:anaerobic magnesium-protoporphyrin IX monomethyl ester cyclase
VKITCAESCSERISHLVSPQGGGMEIFMKIHLIYAASSVTFVGEEYLGISRIFSYIQSNKNWDSSLTKLLFDENEAQQISKVDTTGDVYAISVYNDSARFTYKLVRHIKKMNPKAIICFGSQFASNCYDLIFRDCPEVDFIILGNGEKPLFDVLTELDNKKDLSKILSDHPNIVTPSCSEQKHPCSLPITELPLPSRKILSAEKVLFAGIVTKHGCIGKCSFCSVREKPSTREPKDIFKEIIDIHKETGIQCFNFIDPSIDDFGPKGKMNLLELCELILAYPVPFSFRCYIRANSFHDTKEDKQILQTMKDAGFNNIFVGIEAANDSDLAVYNKISSVEDNYRIVRLLREVDINPKMGFIMFNPYSTLESLKQNLAFLLQVKSADIGHYISCLEIYYNSDIYHRLKQENLLGSNYSYIDNLTDYLLPDKQAAEVFQFVRKRLNYSKLFSLVGAYQNFTYTLDYLYPIMKTKIEKYIRIRNEINQKLFILHQQYFTFLYQQNSMEMADRLCNEYLSEVMKIHKECNKYTNGLLKQYVSFKNGIY